MCYNTLTALRRVIFWLGGTMRAVFRVFWEAAKDAWEEMFLLALMNIVTALLLLPVVTFVVHDDCAYSFSSRTMSQVMCGPRE